MKHLTITEYISIYHTPFYQQLIEKPPKAMQHKLYDMLRVDNKVLAINRNLEMSNRTTRNALMYEISKQSYIQGYLQAIKNLNKQP